MTGLWQAQQSHKTHGDGGIRGCVAACGEVIRFLQARQENPELGAPFIDIVRAFQTLQRRVIPELVSLDQNRPRSRSRSSRRKHQQLWAAVCVEILMKHESSRDAAEAKVARHVAKWHGMQADQISPTTIRNWRSMHTASGSATRKHFLLLCRDVEARPDPVGFVLEVLKTGAPGIPQV
jgi:hypothetical protein